MTTTLMTSLPLSLPKRQPCSDIDVISMAAAFLCISDLELCSGGSRAITGQRLSPGGGLNTTKFVVFFDKEGSERAE